jgi:nucleoside-diphosphate-sugar epimerase
LHQEENWPITIVRPSHTYDTVIPIAIGGFKEWTTAQRILEGKPILIHGNGESLWAVTHSRDFAKGFVPLLGMPKAIGQAFHITSDEILTWNNIYEYLGRALGREIIPVYIPTNKICKAAPIFQGSLDTDKSSSVIFDNTKIKTYVPDFLASTPFHQGIRETIEWFLHNPGKQIIDQEKDKIIDQLIEQFR